MNERWAKMEMFLYEMPLINGHSNGLSVGFRDRGNQYRYQIFVWLPNGENLKPLFIQKKNIYM